MLNISFRFNCIILPIFHYKGYNYDADKSSGSMETDVLKSIMVNAFLEHDIVIGQIDVDGDSKIPKLTRGINNLMEKHETKLGSDRAHSKKNLPRKIHKQRSKVAQSQRSKVTLQFCRLYVQRMFQHSFHHPDIEKCESAAERIASARSKMIPVDIHMLPKNKTHTECKKNNYTFCKVAFGDSKNLSSHLELEYPLRIRSKMTKVLGEFFSDDMIKVYTSKGCTSLNECVNHIMAGSVDEKRFLVARAYTAACARGIAQYNEPYLHLQKEMEKFGMRLHSKHVQTLENMIKKQEQNKQMALSHETRSRKHAKKWKLQDPTDYVGDGNGWNQSELDCDGDVSMD